MHVSAVGGSVSKSIGPMAQRTAAGRRTDPNRVMGDFQLVSSSSYAPPRHTLPPGDFGDPLALGLEIIYRSLKNRFLFLLHNYPPWNDPPPMERPPAHGTTPRSWNDPPPMERLLRPWNGPPPMERPPAHYFRIIQVFSYTLGFFMTLKDFWGQVHLAQ